MDVDKEPEVFSERRRRKIHEEVYVARIGTGDTYFDVVLDNQMHPKFNGTQKQVVKWLEENGLESFDHFQVFIGKTRAIVPVKEYLLAVRRAEEVKEHARNTRVLQLVTSAMHAQDAATYHGASNDGMDLVAKKAAEDIIKLFEEDSE